MSSPAMDFVVAGAQKCGTTYLHRVLSTHPELFFSNKKELHYFDDENNFVNNVGNFDDLEVHFKEKGHRLAGEITPIYMYWPNALERIKSYNPNIKLIFILRNPAERAFSHWKMESARNNETRSFKESIEVEIEANFPIHRIHSYVQRGFYAKQLKHVYSLFPAKNIGVFKYEWLNQSANHFLDPICDYLGVSKIENPSNERIFSTDSKVEMNYEDSRNLLEIYTDDLNSLRNYVEWEFDEWRT